MSIASVQPEATVVPLRILHVLDHSVPLQSGYTFRTLAILRQQRMLGWQTFQITGPKQGRSDWPKEKIDGLNFYRTPPARGFKARLPVTRQLAVIDAIEARLLEVAREVQPDIPHAHSPALNAIAALRVGRRLNIPVVYEIRAFWEDAAVDHGTSSAGGLRYRATRAMETYALQRVDAATTICEGLRADIAARGIAAAKITVIPNAVNVADFSVGGARDAELDARWGLEGKRVLGFIGSFYAYEGLHILLQALPAIIASAPDVRLLLVGGGDQESALRQQVAELGLGAHVVFTGRVPHEQVQRYYELTDILIYPRVKMRLTDLVTPLKPLEAMAQGCLLVASDVGGHCELIADGQNGVLFAAGDPAALAETVLTLLTTPQRWEALRHSGRRYVVEQRNWAASVARYRAVYCSVQRKPVC
jgi:PEP-CTERM/exosortase A-associated glycosyltransferase